MAAQHKALGDLVRHAGHLLAEGPLPEANVANDANEVLKGNLIALPVGVRQVPSPPDMRVESVVFKKDGDYVFSASPFSGDYVRSWYRSNCKLLFAHPVDRIEFIHAALDGLAFAAFYKDEAGKWHFWLDDYTEFGLEHAPMCPPVVQHIDRDTIQVLVQSGSGLNAKVTIYTIVLERIVGCHARYNGYETHDRSALSDKAEGLIVHHGDKHREPIGNYFGHKFKIESRHEIMQNGVWLDRDNGLHVITKSEDFHSETLYFHFIQSSVRRDLKIPKEYMTDNGGSYGVGVACVGEQVLCAVGSQHHVEVFDLLATPGEKKIVFDSLGVRKPGKLLIHPVEGGFMVIDQPANGGEASLYVGSFAPGSPDPCLAAKWINHKSPQYFIHSFGVAVNQPNEHRFEWRYQLIGRRGGQFIWDLNTRVYGSFDRLTEVNTGLVSWYFAHGQGRGTFYLIDYTRDKQRS